MNISAEIKELEKRLSENKPVYRIWANMESGDDIEIFSSLSAEETQKEMIEIIKESSCTGNEKISCDDDLFIVESYAITIGAPENYVFIYTPPKRHIKS